MDLIYSESQNQPPPSRIYPFPHHITPYCGLTRKQGAPNRSITNHAYLLGCNPVSIWDSEMVIRRNWFLNSMSDLRSCNSEALREFENKQ
ncbi:hypothetical protein J6590_071081 [Homalodisca vitripennis]|nr:hypothetical protein J6590_094152 [Homalodisca vitripennis]KAG8316772.1 hypothetical protein J6590_042301 [Homalodisca vitripennis]KAG8330093.1 hypothetical protein J6590_071081 [Homalodisca vitripennis]